MKVRRQQAQLRTDIVLSNRRVLRQISDACNARFNARRRQADGELEATPRTLRDKYDSAISSIVGCSHKREAPRTRPPIVDCNRPR